VSDQSLARERRSGTRPEPELGVVEWFVIGEDERAERVARDLRGLGVRHLRTGISWADWHAPGGPDWCRRLFSRLAEDFELLPCIHYTPPSIGIEPDVSAPPARLRDYADFVSLVLEELGHLFRHVELWNEPNNLSDWNWRIDTDWSMFVEMIVDAASWARGNGKDVVLAGPSPLDPAWLDVVGRHGLLEHVDAVGLHAFPGTWEPHWRGWDAALEATRAVLAEHGSDAELWITESGFSTWRGDEHSQVRMLAELLELPVARVYWYAAEDLAADRLTPDGHRADERDYHFGLRRQDGRAKLLARGWADGGLPLVRDLAGLCPAPVARRHRGPVSVITGGAGFIGTNVAERLIRDGGRVVVLDSLSRPGAERNLLWLRETYGEHAVSVEVADVRDPFAVRRALASAERVFHFAAQVAVTASLDDPRDDFGANLAGTVNVLEELRRLPDPPPLLFTSTNKVYGALADVDLARSDDRWEPVDETLREYGVDERRALDFCTPYGCSKGGADQYVLDYAKTYGLPATVFRMSCVYGPHQHGTEDQGWVAHFVLRALQRQRITIYGDGAQVRDVLFVEELVDAMLLGLDGIEQTSGMAFNVGGGPENAVSLLEVVRLVAELVGERPELEFAPERPGDQRYYVSDTRRFHAVTGWRPEVGVPEGLERLVAWISSRRPARGRVAAQGA
jgi:CDP-paratose 2-epimerase